MAERYYVLLVDIIGSAKLADRNSTIRRIEQANAKIEQKFGDDFHAPLEFTRGDETAAVLRRAGRVHEILMEMAEAIWPVCFRSVLVYGELTAGLNTRRSNVIDGPAFAQADAMMRALKRRQQTFRLVSGVEDLDGPAEALMNFLQSDWNGMTSLQREVALTYRQERKQSSVAKRLGKTQQQVSHTLGAIKWELIEAGEKAIRQLFEEIDRRNQVSGGR